jgi:DNA adenine methylase
MVPFLKWPGGKRWLIADYSSLLPKRFDRYIEPFLGGGSVYFHLEPSRAILADRNEELINTYSAVRDHWRALEQALRRFHRDHCEELYYRLRDDMPGTVVKRAARLLYLNRTCFNGIYRVNLDGRFNVPIGSKSAVVLDTDDFASAARLLATAELRATDFETVVDEARGGDMVFADPPYTVSHNNNGFVRYNERLFSWEDQLRLAAALARALSRGVIVVATNADHSDVRKLYRRYGFSCRSVERFSSIAAVRSGRKRYQELIIRGNCRVREQE